MFNPQLFQGASMLPGMAKAAMQNPWVRRALLAAGGATGLGAVPDVMMGGIPAAVNSFSAAGQPNGGAHSPPTDTQMNRRGSIHPQALMSPNFHVGQAFDTLGQHGGPAAAAPGPLGFGGSAAPTAGYYPGMSDAGSMLKQALAAHGQNQLQGPQPYQPTQDVPNQSPPMPPAQNVGYAPGASPQAMAMPPIGAPGALPPNGYDNNGNSTAPTPSMSPLIQQFIQRLMAKS